MTRDCTDSSDMESTWWTNADYIHANDSNSATYNNTAQRWLSSVNCGFNIDAGATITGIQIRLIGCGTGGSAAAREVQLNVVGAGTCTAKTALAQAKCATMTDQTVPAGTADTWSCTNLTPTSVNATTFGMQVRDDNTNASELDEQYSQVTVYYTPGATTTTTLAGGRHRYRQSDRDDDVLAHEEEDLW